jgi:hypothetical protein
LETLPDLGADATIALDQPDHELAASFTREASRNDFPGRRLVIIP